MKTILRAVLAFTYCWLVVACEKEEFIIDPNVKLSFSTDTITFDTVFTTLGSTTKYFTITNPADKSVNVSSISLASGNNSPFRINISGTNASNLTNVEIPPKDSIYIFVEVTVDPTGNNLPMIIKDSIFFNVNGNQQNIKLIAFGQDFHLFNGEVIKSQHWKNDKPYLIYNSVLIDSLETLTIDAGCRIHFFKASSLFIKGTLKACGSLEEPILFQGTRMESEYDELPGQWGAYKILDDNSIYVFGGIHFFAGSVENEIDYAIIKNAEKGIQVDSLGSSENPVLTLKNTLVKNMSLNCLDARTTKVTASNCVFSNSGSHPVALRYGGDYEFNHCTIANYFADTDGESAVFINNYYIYNKQAVSFPIQSSFNNCIIYGTQSDEVTYNVSTNNSFHVSFESCLLRSTLKNSDAGFTFSNTLFNKDPIFVNNKYELDAMSPARNIGNKDVAMLFPSDLKNNSRIADDNPDLGAFEFIQKEN